MFRHGNTGRMVTALLALSLTLTLAACSCEDASREPASEQAVSAAGFPITIIDDAGRQVVIEAPPERIVSLTPANTEIVAALGGLDRLVGVTTFCDYPPEVADIKKIGDFAQPNVEAIAAADPDVVFATGGVQADVIAKLEEAGAVVVVVDPQSLEQLYSGIARVATVMGVPAESDRLIGGMRAALDEVKVAVAGEKPARVFLEIAQDPLYTVGPGTLMDELIGAAGGVNVVTTEGYVAYSLEQLVKDDPDVYLATKGSMSDPADLSRRAGYGSLAAVKGGKVAVLDDNLVSRPGPRVVEGVRLIAKALHPAAFGK